MMGGGDSHLVFLGVCYRDSGCSPLVEIQDTKMEEYRPTQKKKDLRFLYGMDPSWLGKSGTLKALKIWFWRIYQTRVLHPLYWTLLWSERSKKTTKNKTSPG